jgi:hypothetical protein
MASSFSSSRSLPRELRASPGSSPANSGLQPPLQPPRGSSRIELGAGISGAFGTRASEVTQPPGRTRGKVLAKVLSLADLRSPGHFRHADCNLVSKKSCREKRPFAHPPSQRPPPSFFHHPIKESPMSTEHPLEFHCPHCHVHLGASLQVAGKTVQCPQCKKPIKVPTESEAAASGKPGSE